jgi:HAD superfamily 5'-nucleotidase-like hydrolase
MLMNSSLPVPIEPPPPDPTPSTRVSEYRASQTAPLHGVSRENRIFVNRNLRMRSIAAFGFDLDYTLARYRIREIDELAFRLTKQKLVEKRGHLEGILAIPFDPEFVVRGLVIDRKRGNILKMDYHNYVARAYHGRNPLTTEERKRTYRMRRVRTSAEAYVSVDTLFHLPEVYLYLALVDFYEAKGRTPDFRQLYQDVRDMIDESHADGSIKSEIQKDPGRFVSPDARLGEFLEMLRAAGKKVFLLTNSEYYFTDVLLSYLLDGPGRPGWRHYFDLVTVDACKPGFFRESQGDGRFLDVDGPGAPVYAGGDVWALERMLGFAGDSILYWGDHTYGDILRSKKSVGWRTAMIIPELEREIAITEEIAPLLSELDEAVELRNRVHQEEQIARTECERLAQLLEDARGCAAEARREVARKLHRAQERLAAMRTEMKRQHRRIADLDATSSATYNRHWGMLFREGHETTRFAHQVKDFACIYTSRVSNFLSYPMNTYFHSPVERLPHEL